MAYGLTERDLAHILSALRQFPQIEQALIFGSRAKGTCKTGSDVDLAIKGKAITYQDVTRLSDLLNERFPLPYFFQTWQKSHTKILCRVRVFQNLKYPRS